MKTVEMRKILKEAGQKVPRNNPDVEKAYDVFTGKATTVGAVAGKVFNEAFEKDAQKSIVKLVSSNIYTYVGMGDEPPHKIKFMDTQWFTRGLPVEVKTEILEKVSKHPCFRKGEVNMDEFYDIDEIEKKKADKQREEDLKLQIEAERSVR